jgi:hypothetical protein
MQARKGGPMRARENDRKGERPNRLGRAMKAFAGFMTAVAAIATATATILGLRVGHQSAQLAQIRVIVSQQAQQIKYLKTGPGASPSAPPTGGGSRGAGAPLPSGTHYLSDLTPTVDNQGVSTGQQMMVAKPYPNSISFYCDGPSGDQPNEAYDVAGSATFTTLVGIPDNMSDVTDVIATVTFTNEANQDIGKPVQVSLGHPAKVTLNISGVTQLGVTCQGRDARTDQTVSSFQVALGDARVF